VHVESLLPKIQNIIHHSVSSTPIASLPSVTFDQDTHTDASLNMTYSTCPSPHHRGKLRPSVFHDSVEERIEWRTDIAGVKLAEMVPLRWRGCSQGCLAFLERDNAELGTMDTTDENWMEDFGESVL